MPTLNDPTFTQNHLYYAFITNLSNKIDSVLRTITQNDIFISYVDCQPIIPFQDVEIQITNREGVSVTEETENLVSSICAYLYNNEVKSYEHLNYTNGKGIYINILLTNTNPNSVAVNTEVFTTKNEITPLNYDVPSGSYTDDEDLRYKFIVGYYPNEKSWSLDDHTKEYIEEYNEWFKTNTIDVATAQLISAGKQLVERSH